MEKEIRERVAKEFEVKERVKEIEQLATGSEKGVQRT